MMNEEEFISQLLNVIKIISEHYEEFQVLVKPMGIDIRIDRDELDAEELQLLLNTVNEINRLGIEARLIVSAALEDGEPIIRALISIIPKA